MGYRSEWRIVAIGTDKQIKKLIDWMESYPDNGGELYENNKSWVHDILQTAQFSPTKDAVQFGEDENKCHGTWDKVVREILEHGREVLGLDMAYGRLGEDMEDYEFDNDSKGNAHVFYTRSLQDADFLEGSRT